MASDKKPDETKAIEVVLGPDRGARWTVPADVADQAIADGWARDAMQAPPEDAEPLTAEQHENAIAAAIKAARNLRGEPDEDDDGEYETADMQPRRGPGRPRKS